MMNFFKEKFKETNKLVLALAIAIAIDIVIIIWLVNYFAS